MGEGARRVAVPPPVPLPRNEDGFRPLRTASYVIDLAHFTRRGGSTCSRSRRTTGPKQASSRCRWPVGRQPVCCLGQPHIEDADANDLDDFVGRVVSVPRHGPEDRDRSWLADDRFERRFDGRAESGIARQHERTLVDP